MSSSSVDATLIDGVDTFRAAVYWSAIDNEMVVGYRNLTADGSWIWDNTPATYDGAFAAGTNINLFYQQTFTNQIHDIKVLNKALTTDEIEAKY